MPGNNQVKKLFKILNSFNQKRDKYCDYYQWHPCDAGKLILFEFCNVCLACSLVDNNCIIIIIMIIIFIEQDYN